MSFYYLHENGDLIHKNFEPEQEAGGFVKKVWKVDVSNRACGWGIVLEALALGANLERVKELSTKWGLTFDDSVEFIARVTPTNLMRDGLEIFIEKVLSMESDDYWDKVKEKLEEMKKGKKSNG